MKRSIIFAGTALACVVTAINVGAMPQFKDIVIKYHKPSATAAKALSCTTCHISSSNFGRNPYGKQIEKEMGSKKDLTTAILEKIAKLDADGDGTSNEDEIKAGTNPGDPRSGAAKKSEDKKDAADAKKAPVDEKKDAPEDKKDADNKDADNKAPVDDKKAPAEEKKNPADEK